MLCLVAVTTVGTTCAPSKPHTTIPAVMRSTGTSPSGVAIIVPAGTHSFTGQSAWFATVSGSCRVALQKLAKKQLASFTVSTRGRCASGQASSTAPLPKNGST